MQSCAILAICKIVIVTIIIIIALLFLFQGIQQSHLEHFANLDMKYLVTIMSIHVMTLFARRREEES